MSPLASLLSCLVERLDRARAYFESGAICFPPPRMRSLSANSDF